MKKKTKTIKEKINTSENLGKKYEIMYNMPGTQGSTIVYRIRALRDVGEEVKAGDLGGFVESEINLSQSGNCWIFGNAVVMNDARVLDDAAIRERAVVKDRACVLNNANVVGDAIISGCARILHLASVGGHASVEYCATVQNRALVTEEAQVGGFAIVADYAEVGGRAYVNDYAKVVEHAIMTNYACAKESATVCGYAHLYNDMVADGAVEIRDKHEIITLGRLGANSRVLQAAPTFEGRAYISCGCFRGDIEAFKAQVKKHYGDDPNGDYMLIIPLLKKREAEWVASRRKPRHIEQCENTGVTNDAVPCIDPYGPTPTAEDMVRGFNARG